MPNWCQSQLHITGDVAELKLFREKTLVKLTPIDEYQLDYEYEFTFEGLLPTPDETLPASADVSPKTDEETESEYDDRVAEYRDKHGYHNWYEWRVENWGTKWDAHYTTVALDIDEELDVAFCTAWQPPIDWLKRVSLRFPNLSFHLSYMEEGVNFAGNLIIGDGEISENNGDVIWEDDAGREVLYNEGKNKWTYIDDASIIDDEDFYPIAVNPFERNK